MFSSHVVGQGAAGRLRLPENRLHQPAAVLPHQLEAVDPAHRSGAAVGTGEAAFVRRPDVSQIAVELDSVDEPALGEAAAHKSLAAARDVVVERTAGHAVRADRSQPSLRGKQRAHMREIARLACGAGDRGIDRIHRTFDRHDIVLALVVGHHRSLGRFGGVRCGCGE